MKFLKNVGVNKQKKTIFFCWLPVCTGVCLVGCCITHTCSTFLQTRPSQYYYFFFFCSSNGGSNFLNNYVRFFFSNFFLFISFLLTTHTNVSKKKFIFANSFNDFKFINCNANKNIFFFVLNKKTFFIFNNDKWNTGLGHWKLFVNKFLCCFCFAFHFNYIFMFLNKRHESENNKNGASEM